MKSVKSTALPRKRTVTPPAQPTETPGLRSLPSASYDDSIALRTGARVLPSNPGDNLKLKR